MNSLVSASLKYPSASAAKPTFSHSLICGDEDEVNVMPEGLPKKVLRTFRASSLTGSQGKTYIHISCKCEIA